MSDQANVPQPDPQGDERDWPTRCPRCGTELASATVDLDTSKARRPELRPGEMVEVDFCPNPDCPSHAPMEDRPTGPGSLGGDNGGG
jgi:hypothetical protein